jgi:hypothetical protein
VTRFERVGFGVVGGLFAVFGLLQLLEHRRERQAQSEPMRRGFLAPTNDGSATAAPAAPVNLARAVVRQSDYGDGWPFSVPDGVLSCIADADRRAVLFEADGVRYALNGTAQGKKTMARLGLVDVRSIWRDDPSIPGAKVSLGALLERAERLSCD